MTLRLFLMSYCNIKYGKKQCAQAPDDRFRQRHARIPESWHQNTQAVLKPMTLALLMHVAREYRNVSARAEILSLSDRIIRYIGEHTDKVTLGMVAAHFSYHPNYISSLLRQKTGRTFSEILLEQRMDRALALLKGTSLSVEEVSAMVGYNDTSNFYRAFRGYYRVSPREYYKE